MFLDIRRTLWLAVLGIFFIAPSQVTLAGEGLRVVTTTKTFASLVEAVGGNHVKVDYVAPPNQNVHFIQPRPSDILRLSKADLFVHAGLDLELWRYPLAEASGRPEFLPGGERELGLSQGIHLLEVPSETLSRSQGDIHIYGNPHYWLNPENGRVMARTIFDKLVQITPEYEPDFRANLNQFLEKLDSKIAAWKRDVQDLAGVTVVAYHNSWSYLAQFGGFEIAGFVEPKPGIPPTPRHVERLLGIMQEKGVKLILKETYFEDRTPKKLAQKTGAHILTMAHGVGNMKGVEDYVSIFDYNFSHFKKAMAEIQGGTR